jgi:hypothetical protein
MKKLLRDNGLSIVLFLLFAVSFVGHALAGWHQYNEDQREHGQTAAGFTAYLGTGAFGESVFENWESEFLQMGLYVVLTSFLFQRGSAESKDPDGGEEVDANPRLRRNRPGTPAPVRWGGLAYALYANSLSLALFGLFLFSFVGHVITGAVAHNEEALTHHQPLLTSLEYLRSAQFWFESFQNWQSEFLSIFAIVLLSVWLRQYGSPESKPVAAPHSQTGS